MGVVVGARGTPTTAAAANNHPEVTDGDGGEGALDDIEAICMEIEITIDRVRELHHHAVDQVLPVSRDIRNLCAARDGRIQRVETVADVVAPHSPSPMTAVSARRLRGVAQGPFGHTLAMACC